MTSQTTGTTSPVPPGRKTFHGVVAVFPGPRELLEAIREAREAGYTRLEAHSPFPVHGVEDALGLRRSPLPWFVLGGGLTGAALALAGQLYINVIEYPIIVGGKPHAALEPLVPITFGATILFAALAAVGGMLALNGLPRFDHPVFEHPQFPRATDDRFLLVIEARDPQFDGEQSVTFLTHLGGEHVALLREEG